MTRSERPFKEMTFAEKRERLDYLLFRMKVICKTIFFIQRTRKLVEYREKENYQLNFDLWTVDHKKGDTQAEKIMAKLVKIIKVLWRFNIFFWLWFNMLHIPMIMIWPDLTEES